MCALDTVRDKAPLFGIAILINLSESIQAGKSHQTLPLTWWKPLNSFTAASNKAPDRTWWNIYGWISSGQKLADVSWKFFLESSRWIFITHLMRKMWREQLNNISLLPLTAQFRLIVPQITVGGKCFKVFRFKLPNKWTKIKVLWGKSDLSLVFNNLLNQLHSHMWR